MELFLCQWCVVQHGLYPGQLEAWVLGDWNESLCISGGMSYFTTVKSPQTNTKCLLGVRDTALSHDTIRPPDLHDREALVLWNAFGYYYSSLPNKRHHLQ